MKNKFLLATALSASFAACITMPIQAKTMQSVSTDKGNAVVGTDGSCLRTKWSDKKDCAVAKQPAKFTSSPDADQRTVYFDSGKSTLTANSKQKLDALVAWVKSAPEVKSANIVGYADSMGNAAQNQKLSNARAKSVQNYLRKKGVTLPTNVEVRGSNADSTTNCDDSLSKAEKAICLAADRRVEIEFTK